MRRIFVRTQATRPRGWTAIAGIVRNYSVVRERRRLMLAVLICAVLVLLANASAVLGARSVVVTSAPQLRVVPHPSTAMAATSQSHRYVILLDGISSYDRPYTITHAKGETKPDHAVIRDLAHIRNSIPLALPDAHILYFSYALGPLLDAKQDPATAWASCATIPATDGCTSSTQLPQRMYQEPNYTESQTKLDLATHARGLAWMLKEIVNQDPQAEIDLVGFSLGGVVASLWAATYGDQGGAASHVHAIVLVESPVGGFALANEMPGSCALLDVPCHLWFDWGLPTFFGKPVLRDLQVPGNGVQGSIVGELATKVTPRFDVTSIQSNADYLVNGTPLRVCDNVKCKTSISMPMGSGTQAWSPPPLAEHDSSSLGGALLTNPIPPGVYGPLFKHGTVQVNHTAPLKQNQTAGWVDQALTMNGPRWKDAVAKSHVHSKTLHMMRLGQIGNVTWFRVSVAYGVPTSITAGSDGNVWFIEDYIGGTPGAVTGIVRMSPDFRVTGFFPMPSADRDPGSLVTGPDGNLWFDEPANGAHPIGRIGRVTPKGQITEFVIPHASLGPGNVITGPDGNLWFSWIGANHENLSRLNPGGSITNFTFPPTTAPLDFVVGQDGNLWFTDMSGSIGRFSLKTHVFTSFRLPADAGRPSHITADLEGNLWFTEPDSGHIGRITLQGSIREFSVSGSRNHLVGITRGPDGNVWFTGLSGKIGRITLRGVVTEFSLPGTAGSVGDITSGPNSSLWFTGSSNEVGRIVVK